MKVACRCAAAGSRSGSSRSPSCSSWGSTWRARPRDQLSARFLLGGIHLYQATLSPRMGALGVHCRFKPTCSHYGEGAIRKYGAWTGSWKTLWRIARCGPWTPAGTVDPP